MGDDAIDAMIYAINRETGEKTEIGKGCALPKLAPGGLEFKDVFFEEFIGKEEFEIAVKPKTITKKRFIKLLMGMGYQRNEASKMHEEYMKYNKFRTELGMTFFEIFYNTEPKIKLRIGDEEIDVDSQTDNM